VLAYEADGAGTPVRWLGGGEKTFARLTARADLLINFDYRSSSHVVGHFARSALVDLDPGLLQQWISFGQLAPAPHDHWFTIGETVGTARAGFPDAGIDWHRIGRVVHLPSWPVCPPVPDATYTTVTSWWGDEWITDGAGLLYENNKRVTFLEYADLPLRSGAKLELAAYFGDSRTGSPRRDVEVKPEEAAGDAEDVRRMRRGGWRLRRSAEVAADPWAYRRYIQASRGEFSCAKPSCLVLQNAWVSDRTLCYLASGRPAVVQHTGPSDFLPDAEGLFRFSCRDEAVEALRTVERDYRRQRTAARELAESLFDSGPILSRLLDNALSNPAGGRGRGRSGAPPATRATERAGQGRAR
ncbi:MAG: hypothetical protein M3N57_04920, partial [Actinomycetota bacterium]|nr:hypothetical protein [Actinomycetota bacterium]